MDVQRYVELLTHLPEGVVLWRVIEEVRLAVGARVLPVADQGAVEAELGDAAAELLTGLYRVVHGETGKSAQLLGVGLDLLSDPVVDLGGPPLGFGLIGNALDAGHGQGDNGVANAVGISETDTLVVDVGDLAHVAVTVVGVDIELGLTHRLGFHASHLVGLLESDLSEHLGGSCEGIEGFGSEDS